jgi:hypothetical protein
MVAAIVLVGAVLRAVGLGAQRDSNNVEAIIGVARVEFPDAGLVVGPESGSVISRGSTTPTYVCRRGAWRGRDECALVQVP